ncbi:MAG: hypothetical protein U9N61_04655, partial [Euryarchaeota archaeon]|nr:hypothetical protein [Euryarchaeota archaeon]
GGDKAIGSGYFHSPYRHFPTTRWLVFRASLQFKMYPVEKGWSEYVKKAIANQGLATKKESLVAHITLAAIEQ